MTRYIRRRTQPRKPWEYREVWQEGAPKTCMTNVQWPIYRQITAKTRMPVGDYDPLLRLYRKNEPDELLPEWDSIPEQCQWIELVDDEEEIVLRLDMKSARMLGRRNRHGRWTLPLDHYTVYEQEQR